MRPAFAFAALLLAGCQSQPLRLDANGFGVWRDTELIPYLSEQVARHPRFHASRFAVVKVDGARVEPRMDAFTAGLRERIQDALLELPGDRLAAATPGAGDGIPGCSGTDAVDYLIGIDARPQPGERLRISVRAYDLGEQSWVGGFGRVWEGRSGPGELAALTRLALDESLRGRRELPFEPDQADLVARRLAATLSCHLRRQGAPRSRLYLEPAGDDAPFGATTRRLLGHYLAAFGAVEITNRATSAELRLRTEFHPIEGDLHQLWATIDASGADAVDTAGADVYVRLAPVPASAPEPVAAPMRPVPPPTLTARLLVPTRPALCDARNPWREGFRRLPADGARVATHCFAVELTLHDGARAFLLEESDGTLYRLAPDRCQGLVRLDRRARLRFPGARRGRGTWPVALGGSTLHVVVATERHAAHALGALLGVLPGRCDGPVASDRAPPGDAWRERLRRLTEDHRDAILWQSARLERVAGRERLGLLRPGHD